MDPAMTRWALRLLLVAVVGSAGCPLPGPVPPLQTECPAVVSNDEFRTSLFRVYEYALAPGGAMPLSAMELNTAATVVRCGIVKHQEYWRRIALARLAARSTTDPVALKAERLLMHPDIAELVPTLQLKLAGIIGRAERFAIAYTTVVLSFTGQPGMPTCQSTAPITDAHATGWLAVGTGNVLLGTSVTQVKNTMDPRKWSQGCASLVFIDTHLAKHLAGGGFSVNPSTCTANPAPGFFSGLTWTGDLYEHFVPLTYANSFLKNILTINASMTPASAPVASYHVHYTLNKSLQGQVNGEPPLMCGTPALYDDNGNITGTDTGSGWVSVTATKTVSFTENFEPNHHPPDLATNAATGLHVMFDALPLMICCPP